MQPETTAQISGVRVTAKANCPSAKIAPPTSNPTMSPAAPRDRSLIPLRSIQIFSTQRLFSELLEQSKRPERGMDTVPDHDVVVQFNLKDAGGCFQFARRLDVLSRWLGISGPMILEQVTA